MSASIFDPSQNMYVRQVGIAQYNNDRLRKETLQKNAIEIEKEKERKKKLIIEEINKAQTQNNTKDTNKNLKNINIIL